MRSELARQLAAIQEMAGQKWPSSWQLTKGWAPSWQLAKALREMISGAEAGDAETLRVAALFLDGDLKGLRELEEKK